MINYSMKRVKTGSACTAPNVLAFIEIKVNNYIGGKTP